MSAPLHEKQSEEPDTRLEALLIEGLTTGEDLPITQDFWRELMQDARRVQTK